MARASVVPEALETRNEPDFCALLTGIEIGDLLDAKYRIEGVLGVGGMGVVLAATHLDLRRPVAIKVLRAELVREQRIVTRLLREGRATASIRSEHVSQVIDVGRLENGAPYVVMERLDGTGLDRVLEASGPLPLVEAVDAIAETCEALALAHADGIVHRDLKPANLFLARRADGSPLIKLLDFGISKIGRRRSRSLALTDPHLALGSPNYMAPEQIKAADDVDPRADVWALGAILYELLTTRQAFDAADLNVLQAKILLEEHVPLRALRPDVPPAIERVVRRCLMKHRDARYPDVAALVADLVPHGSSRSERAARRIARARALATPDGTALPKRERRSLVRFAISAGVAFALAFVGGFAGASLLWPAPTTLAPIANRIEPNVVAAQRFVESRPTVAATPQLPELIPASAAEPEPESERLAPGEQRWQRRPVQRAEHKMPWVTSSRRTNRYRPAAP